MTHTERKMPFVEFVALTALMMSLVALSIDAMLPALPEIGRDLGVTRSNDNQLIISLLFLGLAVGQMIYGPVSDSTGRKPAIYAGFALFISGCLLSFSIVAPIAAADILMISSGFLRLEGREDIRMRLCFRDLIAGFQ